MILVIMDEDGGLKEIECKNENKDAGKEQVDGKDETMSDGLVY